MHKDKVDFDDEEYHSTLIFRKDKNQLVQPEEFYKESDGDDFTGCINKAIEEAVERNKAILFSRKYRISDTIKLLDNTTIIGEKGSELFCDENVPITLIEANDRKNIKIYGVNFNGNVIGVIKKNYTRVVRFINCKGVLLQKITSGNNADWCISFEGCSDVFVADLIIYGGGRGLPGGRDGIHFLDCSNFTIKRAVIDSGDDCVGITTKFKNSREGYISDVVGSSEIGSVVIYNEELLAEKNYSTNDMVGLRIKNISVLEGSKPKNIVRVIAYNKNSSIRNVTLDGISGSSLNHSVFIGNVQNLTIRNVDVFSVEQHGVYIINSTNINSTFVTGHSETKKYYGVSIVKCHNVFGDFTSIDNNIPEHANLQDNTEVKIRQKLK
ncbi:glycosyl hydrolase family 28 protein [Serratia fonticola]|uniref:glycosyl hydrolase family 28 protein n=1 Tax=Serratia fonticola TaxID=47917 RepID=UPI0021BDD2EC|nr:glycosyl hydrolase family 28 protein [Serratia fonticola]